AQELRGLPQELGPVGARALREQSRQRAQPRRDAAREPLRAELELDAGAREERRMRRECLGVGAGELEIERQQEVLALELVVDERTAQALEQDSLVRGVLVEEHEPRVTLEHEIQPERLTQEAQLRERERRARALRVTRSAVLACEEAAREREVPVTS